MFSVQAQEEDRRLKKPNRKFENFEYASAIKGYEKWREKGLKSEELFKKLGDSYYYISDFKNAAMAYSELFKLTDDVEPQYYYRYAQTLKTVGNYELSDAYTTKYNSKVGAEVQAAKFVENPEDIERINSTRDYYKVQSLSINSELSDFAPSFNGDKLVFTSNRIPKDAKVVVHKWNNQPFLELYETVFDEDGNAGEVYYFDKNINSKYHESTTAFTKDGRFLYFTRSNYFDSEYGESDTGANLLKLYRAEKVGDEWTNISELPFTSDNYNTAHPALSPDDKKLYFVSDMEGSLGESDIFVVDINEDNTYGTPQTLGNVINTPAKETFPFVSEDNTLYFASNGHLGLGGLDIFSVKIIPGKVNKYGKVVNMGEPINGAFDDFSYIVNDKTNKGYFSSNRPGGMGDDDIYTFTRNRDKTKITNRFDDKVKNLGEAKTDTVYVNVPVIKYVSGGEDLAKELGLNTIYFDLDKWNIRPDAARELDRIAATLKDNPTLAITINSHTDSREDHNYNVRLSKRRADATLNYLRNKGISQRRLKAVGYGKILLVNECETGVRCSEEKHQENRRSEFVVNGK
ncbi:OmpA family protein [Gangjinia marincola]|uniref:OmpA family protein n=1 Tax=Gangjinia marincola TaxID=578463 RepID=A0ABN1MH00_9FLAO